MPLRARLVACLFVPLALSACPAAENHHPGGYGAADVHPIDAKMATEDCRDCHGAQLDGGTSEVSCDTCHIAGWREDCTYCHGGTETDSGAPPRDIDGNVDPDTGSYWPHTTHTTETDGPAYACDQCHVLHTSVTDEGHLFDGTPGVAVVYFWGGLSPDASWSGDGCTNAYCHGNGRTNGDQILDVSEVPCGECHAVGSDSVAAIGGLGGEHREHAQHNVSCEECHQDTSDGTDIIDPAAHVDGEPTLQMPYGVTRDNGRCTGSCHNENHNNAGW